MTDFSRWAADEEGWDQEEGAPGIALFGKAVQVWSIMQNRVTVTVAEAARAFNVPEHRIIEAVADHPWMYLVGPADDYTRLSIEHDGE